MRPTMQAKMHQQKAAYYVPSDDNAVRAPLNNGQHPDWKLCPQCSYGSPSQRQLNQHQFEKNHVFFCGFESEFRANDHKVKCDKWFYTLREFEEHEYQEGHFYAAKKNAHPEGKSHKP